MLREHLFAGGPGWLGKGQLNRAKSGPKSWKRTRFPYWRTTVVEKTNFAAWTDTTQRRFDNNAVRVLECDPDQTQLPEEGDQCLHTEALRPIQELWQLLEARVDIFPTCLTSTGVTTGHKNINKSTGGLGDPVFSLKLTRAAPWARLTMSRELWWLLKCFGEHRSHVNQVSWAVSATLKMLLNGAFWITSWSCAL